MGESGTPQTEGRRLSYRFRLYPTPKQQEYFRLNFKACAFVYDYFLDRRFESYRASLTDPSVKPMSLFATTAELTALKKSEVRGGIPWLKKADSAALVYALRHLDIAFTRFFRRAKAGAKRVGPPRHRKGKAAKSSYTTDRCKVDPDGRWVKLPKAGCVKARIHREVQGRVLSATVCLDAAERWFVTINVVDAPPVEAPTADAAMGLQPGVDPWLATSDGEVVQPASELEALERKLARERRKLNRKVPGSARYEEQARRVAKLAMRIADKRSQEIHLVTRRIVDEHAVIVSRGVDAGSCARGFKESLGIGESEARRRAAGAAFGELNRQLAYKSEWAGREFVLLPPSEGIARMEAGEACEGACRVLDEGLRTLRSGDESGNERSERFDK